MPRNTSKLSPMHFIDALYAENQPALAFDATNVEQWKKWRRKLKAKVWELLGGMDDPKCDLKPRVVERQQMDGYVREKVIYNSRPETLVPAWVLIPDQAAGRSEGPAISRPAVAGGSRQLVGGSASRSERRAGRLPGGCSIRFAPPTAGLPAVVACSGHGHGKDDLVGLDDKGRRRKKPSYQNDFAIQMVRRGFVVIAPEQLGFGERRDPWDIEKGPNCSCQQHSMAALLLGRTNSGMRVYDTVRAIDYLQTRPEVDARRIGCLGISGGGLVTLFSAAMDDRIRACLVSGYTNLFRDCIIPIGHCADNYIPSILRYAEMSDVASLIAPRAFFAEGGSRDTIFPVKAVRESFKRIRCVYDLLDLPDKRGLHIFDDEHVFNGKKGMPFLEKWV